MIPAEAVEPAADLPGAAILAAEAAVFDAMIEYGPDGHTDGHDKITRAALEAAAPHIRAQALEDAAAAQSERVTAIEQTLVDEYQYDTLCAMREQANQDLIWLTERVASERGAP